MFSIGALKILLFSRLPEQRLQTRSNIQICQQNVSFFISILLDIKKYKLNTFYEPV